MRLEDLAARLGIIAVQQSGKSCFNCYFPRKFKDLKSVDNIFIYAKIALFLGVPSFHNLYLLEIFKLCQSLP